RVQGSGFSVQGSGFRVQGSRSGFLVLVRVRIRVRVRVLVLVRVRVRVLVRVLVRRLDRRAVGEFLDAGGDDPLARLDAVEDWIVLAGDRADGYRALLRHELAASLLGDEREELAVD